MAISSLRCSFDRPRGLDDKFKVQNTRHTDLKQLLIKPLLSREEIGRAQLVEAARLERSYLFKYMRPFTSLRENYEERYDLGKVERLARQELERSYRQNLSFFQQQSTKLHLLAENFLKIPQRFTTECQDLIGVIELGSLEKNMTDENVDEFLDVLAEKVSKEGLLIGKRYCYFFDSVNIFTNLEARQRMIACFSTQIEKKLQDQISASSLKERIFNRVAEKLGDELRKDTLKEIKESIELSLSHCAQSLLQEGDFFSANPLLSVFFNEENQQFMYVSEESWCLLSQLEQSTQLPFFSLFEEPVGSIALRKEVQMQECYDWIETELNAEVDKFRSHFIEDLSDLVINKCLKVIRSKRSQVKWLDSQKQDSHPLENPDYVINALTQLIRSKPVYQDFCVLLELHPEKKESFLRALHSKVKELMQKKSHELSSENLVACFVRDPNLFGNLSSANEHVWY